MFEVAPDPSSPHGRKHFWPEHHLQPNERQGRDEYSHEESCLTKVKLRNGEPNK
jgi:hypothetical protein